MNPKKKNKGDAVSKGGEDLVRLLLGLGSQRHCLEAITFLLSRKTSARLSPELSSLLCKWREALLAMQKHVLRSKVDLGRLFP